MHMYLLALRRKRCMPGICMHCWCIPPEIDLMKQQQGIFAQLYEHSSLGRRRVRGVGAAPGGWGVPPQTRERISVTTRDAPQLVATGGSAGQVVVVNIFRDKCQG